MIHLYFGLLFHDLQGLRYFTSSRCITGLNFSRVNTGIEPVMRETPFQPSATQSIHSLKLPVYSRLSVYETQHLTGQDNITIICAVMSIHCRNIYTFGHWFDNPETLHKEIAQSIGNMIQSRLFIWHPEIIIDLLL